MLEEAEILRKDGKQLLQDFLINGPFSSDWDAPTALKYLAEIRAQLNALKMKQKQLGNDLAIFGLSLPDCIELMKLEEVFNLLNQNDIYTRI